MNSVLDYLQKEISLPACCIYVALKTRTFAVLCDKYRSTAEGDAASSDSSNEFTLLAAQLAPEDANLALQLDLNQALGLNFEKLDLICQVRIYQALKFQALRLLLRRKYGNDFNKQPAEKLLRQTFVWNHCFVVKRTRQQEAKLRYSIKFPTVDFAIGLLANFFQTLDERFIVTTVSTEEVEMFSNFALYEISFIVSAPDLCSLGISLR